MKITYFKLEMRPSVQSRYIGGEELVLEIKMNVDGKIYDLNKCLSQDDFLSNYDQIFEDAQKELRGFIINEKNKTHDSTRQE